MLSIVFLIRSTGKMMQKVLLPVRYVQSFVFGGKNLDTIFVTTNAAEINPMLGRITSAVLSPENGKLYQITGVGVQGLPTIHLKKGFPYCKPDNDLKRFVKNMFKHHHHHHHE